MESTTYTPNRGLKQKIRLMFISLVVGLGLCLPFGTMLMAWLLGFHPNLGTPLWRVPTRIHLFVLPFVALCVAGGAALIYWKKKRPAGALILLSAISAWLLAGPVYNPLYVLRWLYSYWDIPELQPILQNFWLYMGGYYSYVLVGFYLLFRRPTIAPAGSHGTARLTDGDQFLQEEGLIIGRHRTTDRLLRWRPDKHLITAAPTRRGKGVGSIIPNLLTYPKSLIVVDPKGENCDISWERRMELGQDVYVLDPFYESGYAKKYKTNMLNFLDVIEYQDPEAFDICNVISRTVITDDPHSDPFWMNCAHTLFAGLLYYITQAPEFNDPSRASYHPEMRNMTTINDLLGLPFEDLQAYMEQISASTRLPLDVKEVANDILNEQESRKMLNGIIKTLKVNLECFRSPRIRDTMRESDFSLDDIIDGTATLYLVIPIDKISSYNKWLRVVIELIIKRTIQRRETLDPDNEDNRILFLLDEYANLGNVNYVKEAYSTAAGYGMTLWTFVQDFNQLEKIYPDDWQTFISNSGILQVFNTNDLKTAQHISKILGKTTVFSESSGENKAVSQVGMADARGQTQTVSEQGRWLRTPNEIMTMDMDRQLIKPDGQDLVVADKVQYFAAPEFQGLYIPREEAAARSQSYDPPAPTRGRQAESVLKSIIYGDRD